MSEYRLLLVITTLLLVGGVWAVVAHIPFSIGRRADVTTSESSPGPGASTHKRQSRETERGSRNSRADPRLSSPVLESAALSQQVGGSERQSPEQPRASDIRADMPLQELTTRFGPPNYIASWSSGGKLNQMLLYERGSALLEIRLQDGRVTSTRY